MGSEQKVGNAQTIEKIQKNKSPPKHSAIDVERLAGMSRCKFYRVGDRFYRVGLGCSLRHGPRTGAFLEAPHMTAPAVIYKSLIHSMQKWLVLLFHLSVVLLFEHSRECSLPYCNR